MAYPKWKYRKDPQSGAFQSTLVGTAEAETEIGNSWTDDPHGHGVAVVPYPAQLYQNGTLMHFPDHCPDANGNHAHGPAPTVPGMSSVPPGFFGKAVPMPVKAG